MSQTSNNAAGKIYLKQVKNHLTCPGKLKKLLGITIKTETPSVTLTCSTSGTLS